MPHSDIPPDPASLGGRRKVQHCRSVRGQKSREAGWSVFDGRHSRGEKGKRKHRKRHYSKCRRDRRQSAASVNHISRPKEKKIRDKLVKEAESKERLVSRVLKASCTGCSDQMSRRVKKNG